MVKLYFPQGNMGRCCVIFYVRHFQPPHFGPISVQSLLYTPIFLLFTPKYFLRLPAYVVVREVREWGEGGGSHWWRRIIRGFAHVIILARDLLRPDAGYQSGSRSRRGLGSQAPQIMRKYDLANAIAIRPLIQPRTCKMGSSIFLPWVDSNSWVRPGLPSL